MAVRRLSRVQVLVVVIGTLSLVFFTRVWDRIPASKPVATTTSETAEVFGESKIYNNTVIAKEAVFHKPVLCSPPTVYNTTKYVWKLYNSNSETKHIKKAENSEAIFQSNLIDVDVERDFQERILCSIPLHCFSNKYSFFPPKYRKFTNLLIDYAHFHKEKPVGIDPRALVWQCSSSYTCGGSGDRLKGILTSLILAILSKRRFYMHWEIPGLNHYLRPNLIDWNDRHVIDSTKKKDNNVSLQRFRMGPSFFINVNITTWQKYLTIIESDTPYVVLNTNIELYSLTLNETTHGQRWIREGIERAGFTSLSENEINDLLGIVFRYLFIVDPFIINEVKSAMRVLQIDTAPYVGIHLRTGFVGSRHANVYQNKKLIKDRAKWNEALKCAVETAYKQTGNDSYIFLATDSNEVKKMAISRYGLRFRTLDMELVHVDTMMGRNPNLSEKDKKGFATVLVDMLLLAQSYVLLRGESGFSYISGLVCALPEENNLNCFSACSQK